MSTRKLFYIIPVIFTMMLATAFSQAATTPPASEKQNQPAISLPEDVGHTIASQAASVKAEIASRADSLFKRTALGWNWKTIEYLYQWLVGLPLKLPEIIKQVMEQGRVLGVAGSFIVLIFLVTVFYSLLARKKLLTRIEKAAEPLKNKIPAGFYPFFLSALKVLIAALIPLSLLAIFSLVNAMIHYEAAWFQLVGKLLALWAVGALIIGFLRESLTQNLFRATSQYGKRIFQLARLALLYGLVGVALIQCAAAFQVRPDVIAFFRFAVSVTIVVILFLIHLMKKALMSFLPDLPYPAYQAFIRILNRFYYPLIIFAFIVALLWCIGYKQLGRVVLIKIWSSGFAYLLIMLAYHRLRTWLQKWYDGKDSSEEAVQFLFQSFRTVLLYATLVATVLIILNLVGMLDLIERVFSFPIAKVGTTPVTVWLILKAVIILLAFIFAARLLQAYLDYKIYPLLGIDPGLGYALDISFKYAFIAIGLLISLKAVGIGLRFLLVFAGAAGIGIGLGMQHIAADIISGFTIIFGGKIRKGDWIEVENKIGLVTDIFLRATRVRTRDHIEYLIPNSNLISNIMVNYSLSSPMIRIDLPVGVSYRSDPQQIKKILQEVAEKESMVSNSKKPVVRFVEYGDSSLNFELLVWIDVRVTPRRNVRSALYFAIFEEFKKAGIEIPFPQRDLHIRSSDVKHLF
jgi:small-conductance mechanosensitive channel